MYALRLCTRRLGSILPSKTILFIDSTEIVSVGDIAVMKIVAIGGRGAKKDFFDLYNIIKKLYSFMEEMDISLKDKESEKLC